MKKILSGFGVMLLAAGVVIAGEVARPDFSKIQTAVKEKFPEKYEEIMKTAQSDICKARQEMMQLAKEAGLCPKMKGKPGCPKPMCKPDCPKGKCGKCDCPAGECKPACPKGEFKPDCPKGECKSGCPKAECPKSTECAPKKPVQRKPGADIRQYSKAYNELREKCPAEMLELDKKYIALEDEMYELAKANGIDLPRKKVDIRRIRVAFPEELKQLEAQRQNMHPREFSQKLKELAEKLNQK